MYGAIKKNEFQFKILSRSQNMTAVLVSVSLVISYGLHLYRNKFRLSRFANGDSELMQKIFKAGDPVAQCLTLKKMKQMYRNI